MKIIISIALVIASTTAVAQVSARTEMLCEMKGQHAEKMAAQRGKSIKAQETAYENAVFKCIESDMLSQIAAMGGDISKFTKPAAKTR